MLLGPGEQSSVAELGSGAGFPRSLLGYGLSSFLTTTPQETLVCVYLYIDYLRVLGCSVQCSILWVVVKKLESP